MIKLKKATIKDMDFVSKFNLLNIENIYIIDNNNTYVGVVEYISKTMLDEDYESIYIEYIDILEKYRRKGFASNVINLLSNNGDNYIYGNSIPDTTAISFWKSIGADFEGEDEFLESYIENSECLPFFI